VAEASESEALVEAYDEWRRDHRMRTLQTNVLAQLLQRWNITVYRLDLSYNECPPEVLPVISAGYSGYFFVARHARRRGLRPQRLKKLDPTFDRVLQFVQKHSEAKLNASTLHKEFEGTVRSIERRESAQEWAATWGIPVTLAVGLAGVTGFFWGRRQRRHRATLASSLLGSKAASEPALPAAPASASTVG